MPRLSASPALAVIVLLVLAAAAASTAQAADVLETENNNTRANATNISNSAFTLPLPANVFPNAANNPAAPLFPTVTLLGRLGDENDVDFFWFTGQAGEAFYFDVDNAGLADRALDPFLALFDANGTLIGIAEDSVPDPGSAGFSDPFLGLFTLANTGIYYVTLSDSNKRPNAYGTGSRYIELRRPDGAVGGDQVVGATPSDDTFETAITGLPGAYRVQVSRAGTTSVIPEPGTLALLGGAGLLPLAGAVVRRWRGA